MTAEDSVGRITRTQGGLIKRLLADPETPLTD
jgi:hypothetical protein